jgi:AP endonuclease-1
VQRIPLVLETPSFELPETVWKTEIDVLNRLSELKFEGEEVEEVLQEMEKDVRNAVQDAEGASGKKGTKKGFAKKGNNKKKQADVEDEDEDSEA